MYGGSFARHQALFFADLDQYDVGSDLTYFVPGDDIFLVRRQQSAEPEWTGHYDGADASAVLVKDQVADFAKSLAVASVDNIFYF